MNYRQQSKLKMYQVAQNALLANQSITSTLPNFSSYYIPFKNAIKQIQENSPEQELNTTGVAEEKQETRENLTALTLDNAHKINAYATFIDDDILIKETKINFTKLKQKSELQLLNFTKALYANINKQLAHLAEYTITAATQQQLANAITTFEQAIPQPRQIILERKENTALLIQAFSTADDMLTKMDGLIEIVAITQPEFYKEYHNARETIQYGNTTLAVKGQITDSLSKQPIAAATLTFIPQGQTAPAITKQTATKGGFNIKNIQQGVYKVSILKIGYITKNITVAITSDTLCKINQTLEKETYQ